MSVIIPTYNESENIPVLLKRLSSLNMGSTGSLEVLFIDDNSPDLTWEAAIRHCVNTDLNVIVVRRFGRRGLSSAIIDGFMFAKGEYLTVMDADLQHPPEYIPRLLSAALKGHELVIASRYVAGGGTEGWSLLRTLISRGATLLARIMLLEARSVRDPMSGFFLVKRTLLSRCSKLNPLGFKILLEILVKCSPASVAEVPYIFRQRLKGRSKLGLKTIFEYVVHVLKLSGWRPFKFATVGALGYVVNVLATTISTILTPHFYLRNLVGIETSTLFNFTLHELWTFKDRRGGSVLKRLVAFHGAVVPAITTQYIIAQALYYLAGAPEAVSILLGVIVGFIVNYLISELGVWSSRRDEGV